MLKKILLALGLTCTLAAQANVVIIGTRVVYPSDQKSINIQLQNTTDSPALVQSWIDEGDANLSPSKTEAPFLVTPPMVRVDGKAGQTLRLMYTGTKALPEDRESLFYFNLLDVPPKPKAEDVNGQNYLQFAIRSRLKLFYRPAGIKMSVSDAYRSITWTKKEGNQIEINNNTPYYITYDQVRINKMVSDNLDMIAPYSQLTVEVPDTKVGDKVEWKIVNDYGGIAQDETILK